MFECEELKLKIENALKGADVSVRSPRGDGKHFLVKIVWEGFSGVRLLEQQRMVNNALADELKAGLHSLSIKTEVKSNE